MGLEPLERSSTPGTLYPNYTRPWSPWEIGWMWVRSRGANGCENFLLGGEVEG